MEITTFSTNSSSGTRRIAVNALAVVGFIVLIVLGMALAIYAATFVPKAANRLGAAAVYLSHVFVPVKEPANLEVVPFEDAPGAGVATTTATSTTPAATTTSATATTATPTAGAEDYHVYPIGGTTTGTKPYTGPLTGYADLTVTNVVLGYLTSADTASFVASSTIPSGMRGAVKFSIVNTGTNTTGAYDFEAVLPATSSGYHFFSGKQKALLPGEREAFVLGYDSARTGTITITVDSDNTIKEVSESNNTATVDAPVK